MTARLMEIVADGAPGGGTTAVLGLSADLQAAGVGRVTLVTDRGTYAAEQGRALGLDVHELDFFRSRFDPRIRHGLASILARVKPDLVHAHGARAGLPLSLIRRGGEARVYTVHGYHFQGKRRLARWLARAAEARIAKASDHGIFVSEADRGIAQAEAIRFPASSVIYNGIVPEELGTPPAGPKTHDLIFAARLHRQKNPLFVIEIMKALAGSGLRLLLIGGGEMEADVRSAAEQAGVADAITFTGGVPRERVIEGLFASKLFLFPSLWEGLPIAPIEAMACGVPVIGSDIAGTREVVTTGKTGLLLPGFDAAAYAAAIRGLIADPARLAALSAAGPLDVAERFARTRSSQAHAALYRDLLGARA